MSDVSKIKLDGVTYNLKDAVARELIANLPQPMVFKGTLGVNGTISALPTPIVDYEGFVYKVITDGTYAGIVADVGDLFICNDTPEWVLIPSGDEPSGTVTNVATGGGLTGGPITTSGTISVDFNEVQAKLSAGDNIEISVDSEGRNIISSTASGSDLGLFIDSEGRLCARYYVINSEGE